MSTFRNKVVFKSSGWLHLSQVDKLLSSSHLIIHMNKIQSTLIFRAVRSSETSKQTYYPTRWNNTEVCHLKCVIIWHRACVRMARRGASQATHLPQVCVWSFRGSVCRNRVSWVSCSFEVGFEEEVVLLVKLQKEIRISEKEVGGSSA
jgi:hypothetical protein